MVLRGSIGPLVTTPAHNGYTTMAKSNTAAPAANTAQLYCIGARGLKATLSATTKWPLAVATNTDATGATGGNAATLAAVAKLGATFTAAQYKAACLARNHKGFERYGLASMWVVPYAPKA